MPRKKNISDIDESIADLNARISNLKAERKKLADAAKGTVGEAALACMAAYLPTEKARAREFFKHVDGLIAAHRAEFESMFDGWSPFGDTQVVVAGDAMPSAGAIHPDVPADAGIGLVSSSSGQAMASATDMSVRAYSAGEAPLHGQEE